MSNGIHSQKRRKKTLFSEAQNIFNKKYRILSDSNDTDMLNEIKLNFKVKKGTEVNHYQKILA